MKDIINFNQEQSVQVIYKNEYDKQNFDKERYRASLERYGKIDSAEFEKVVKEKLEPFPIRHVSCLVREAIPIFKNEEDARKYYEEHKEGGEPFYRLIRTTGYLTGDYRRSNDSKIAEYANRTVSCTKGVDMKLAYPAISKEYYSAKAKIARERIKAEQQVANQI